MKKLDALENDLYVRRQVEGLEEKYAIHWSDILNMLLALAYHNPPELSWLVQDALEGGKGENR